MTDPKQGLFTVLGAGAPVGGAVGLGLRKTGDVVRSASKVSPKLLAAAQQIVSDLTKKQGLWRMMSTDPEDVARSIQGTAGRALEKYGKIRSPDLAQPTGKLVGKSSEFLVGRPDLEQALLEETARVLPQHDPGAGSINRFLWEPLRNRASEEARTTLARTTLPSKNTLEMEAARLKRLYKSRLEDVTVDNILADLKAANPKPASGRIPAAHEPDAEARVATALQGQRHVPLPNEGRVTPGEDDVARAIPEALQDRRTPEELLADAQEKVKLLRALTTHLSPRQQAMLSMYYGAGDSPAMTLDEIARGLAPKGGKPLSKMSISRELAKATEILAKAIGRPSPKAVAAQKSLTEAARARTPKPPSYETVAGNVVVTDPGVAPVSGPRTAGLVGRGPLADPYRSRFNQFPAPAPEGAAERALARKFADTPPRLLDASKYEAVLNPLTNQWTLMPRLTEPMGPPLP